MNKLQEMILKKYHHIPYKKQKLFCMYCFYVHCLFPELKNKNVTATRQPFQNDVWKFCHGASQAPTWVSRQDQTANETPNPTKAYLIWPSLVPTWHRSFCESQPYWISVSAILKFFSMSSFNPSRIIFEIYNVVQVIYFNIINKYF